MCVESKGPFYNQVAGMESGNSLQPNSQTTRFHLSNSLPDELIGAENESVVGKCFEKTLQNGIKALQELMVKAQADGT